MTEGQTMNAKPRIKRIRRLRDLSPVWECSAADDKATFRNPGRGSTPQSAYAVWKYSNEIPF